MREEGEGLNTTRAASDLPGRIKEDSARPRIDSRAHWSGTPVDGRVNAPRPAIDRYRVITVTRGIFND
jgi:hypothetical protein